MALLLPAVQTFYSDVLCKSVITALLQQVWGVRVAFP